MKKRLRHWYWQWKSHKEVILKIARFLNRLGKNLNQYTSQKGSERKVTLYKRLLDLRSSEEQTVMEFLYKFSNIVEKLTEVEIVLSDQLLFIISITFKYTKGLWGICYRHWTKRYITHICSTQNETDWRIRNEMKWKIRNHADKQKQEQ